MSFSLPFFNKSSKWPKIYACGQDKIFEIDTGKSENGQAEIIWTLSRSEIVIPAKEYNPERGLFDDCKPKNKNKWILATDGYVTLLLEKSTKKVLFYAFTPNSHSAELLPNNRIVVALSEMQNGNAVHVYDIGKSDQVLFRDDLFGGHGVVWIDKRKKLYALGRYELREYSLAGWETTKPRLKQEAKWDLPTTNGHDLVSINNDTLVVTTNSNVHSFSLKTRTFGIFKPLQSMEYVKSVYFNEKTGQLIYTKSYTYDEWWTDTIDMRQPDKKITVPGFHFYKTRVIK